MIIIVKSLQGDEYRVEVQNSQLVADLKAAICDRVPELTADKQRLVYKGRTMHDSSPISDYQLEDGSKVHLLLPPAPPSAQTGMSASKDYFSGHESARRFEQLLRQRLERYLNVDAVDRIMTNLEHEISADISSSSLDDLERLAKQKLKISN